MREISSAITELRTSLAAYGSTTPRGSVSAQGKVLYVRSYPNPSFGPFVEVCCSIIGVFKLLMHVFIHFHVFSPIFCSFPPHLLLSRLISCHFGDPEKAVVHTVVSLGAKSRMVIIKVARRARAGQTPSPTSTRFALTLPSSVPIQTTHCYDCGVQHSYGLPC